MLGQGLGLRLQMCLRSMEVSARGQGCATVQVTGLGQGPEGRDCGRVLLKHCSFVEG